jgi:cellulose synthase/poly-beta-1,6-N-acetylglucosamine synthase-like glycosyltransferase
MTNSGRNTIEVSAIVPARDEEANIAACVESLAGQPEIAEILVVNDQSTDQTAAVVMELAASIPKLRLLEAKELPSGWVGKNNAVWLGAQAAQSEWLLFTDADAVHLENSSARALSIALQENAVMVSFSPEQVMEKWFEKALIPYVYCRLGSKFTFGEINDPRMTAAAANGQFLLIRKDVYQSIGGHANVAGDVLEDVALAKKVKGAGCRIWFGSGKGIVRVRMYRTFGAMWEGWTKNLHALMGNNAESVSEFIRAVAPVMILLIAAIFTMEFTESIPFAFGILIAGILFISVFYDAELRKNGFSPYLNLYGIPGRLLFAGVLLASFRSHRRGRLAWKGREYPVGTPGASK